MDLRPEEITGIIKSRIRDYGSKLRLEDTGTVVTVGDGIVRIHGLEKCMMNALNIPRKNLDVISFYGCWGQERHYQRNKVIIGNQSMFSRRGSSSHNYNPFFNNHHFCFVFYA